METLEITEKMIVNRFGILLAEKRIQEKRNIPLAEVSEKTGIPRKTLFSWASNSVTRYDEHVLNALCVYFNCEVGRLLVWTKDTSTLDGYISIMDSETGRSVAGIVAASIGGVDLPQPYEDEDEKPPEVDY